MRHNFTFRGHNDGGYVRCRMGPYSEFGDEFRDVSGTHGKPEKQRIYTKAGGALLPDGSISYVDSTERDSSTCVFVMIPETHPWFNIGLINTLRGETKRGKMRNCLKSWEATTCKIFDKTFTLYNAL